MDAIQQDRNIRGSDDRLRCQGRSDLRSRGRRFRAACPGVQEPPPWRAHRLSRPLAPLPQVLCGALRRLPEVRAVAGVPACGDRVSSADPTWRANPIAGPHSAAPAPDPLPPPSMFGQHESVLKSGAGRIMTMAEQQQCRRIHWETTSLIASTCDATRGQ
ncbi:MAG: DUF2335 domain-containing protein [Acidobacteriia bacterium]|nr:DUF2335 domain-containing protein [Terriglobia bacterium]MYG03141.1 DUF2335 domain-containing protein [Terriglobia bacterium]MYK11892.1 DUF2335 domain-containing protein [Terriglobia bacterium]